MKRTVNTSSSLTSYSSCQHDQGEANGVTTFYLICILHILFKSLTPFIRLLFIENSLQLDRSIARMVRIFDRGFGYFFATSGS